jgi:glycosyltransferase involved in cell wall biosynthesis
MRIAILGTRGIPARYGGFETFAEELSTRLVQRGHKVTVYCRQRHSCDTYLGVRLRYLPTIRHKYFDTIAHTFLSTLHLLFDRHDVALYCNAANAIFTWIPRASGVPVALNVDGLERHRKKWNVAARIWYLFSERLSTFLPSAVVSDARVIEEYYRTRYNKPTTFIPYGATVERTCDTSTLTGLGVEPGQYVLYVSRMEPENNALLVREAFEKLDTSMKLVLVGDAPYASEYIARVRDTKDPRIILPGAIYGDGYRQLQSHCFAYVQATEVGGTHPALIEAMGRGSLTLFLDTPENREVAASAGVAFTPANLSEVLERVLHMSENERQTLRQAAQERVRALYSWEKVTDAYERLLISLTTSSSS